MPKNSPNSSDSRIASLKQQNSDYNNMYRKWRIDHKKYGFYFSGDSGELTYRKGEGFINDNPEGSEQTALEGVHSAVAATLIVYTLLNLFVTVFFSDFPFSLSNKVFYHKGGYFIGDEKLAVILSLIMGTVVRLLPLSLLLAKTRMPLKLIFNFKISNKPLFFESIPMAMLCFGIFTVFSGITHFTAGLMNYSFGHSIWIPKGRTEFILSVILFTIIIPLTSEIVHRGFFLQILRQFGDGYALLLTSVIAGLTMNGPSPLFCFMLSFVIGYFTMRSGSILTAFVMRITVSVSSYWLTYLRISGNSDDYLTLSIAVTFLFLLVGVISIILFTKKHSNKINLPLYEMYISQKDKIMCCMTNPYVIIWVALAILIRMVSVVVL